MLPYFIRTFYRHFLDYNGGIYYIGSGLEGLEAINTALEDVIIIYNREASYYITNRDESALLFNGYLRQIIKDVTGYDIGMNFHKFNHERNSCTLWHLRY